MAQTDFQGEFYQGSYHMVLKQASHCLAITSCGLEGEGAKSLRMPTHTQQNKIDAEINIRKLHKYGNANLISSIGGR